jgi:hypothetical protein
MEINEPKDLINLKKYPVRNMLRFLLQDKTTKLNIIWATRSYEEFGEQYSEKQHMTEEAILGFDSINVQPRVCKSSMQQAERTKKKAEVFTPSWVCNKMNNHCDSEWFGEEGVFNTEIEQDWIVNNQTIEFKTKDAWKKYVDSKRLEITCGEAPYIVSRYDTSTGKTIKINRRIGIIDRKIRVINENTTTEEDWLHWVIRAYQSTYGYEFQGDNLLIARINLLITFVDYLKDQWNRKPTEKELKTIVNIICWNLWQMDGITGTIPYGKSAKQDNQISLFDYVIEQEQSEKQNDDECRIFDWRNFKKSITYNSVKRSSE